ncbi:MAG: glycosyltransferase [Proteobacteria bacterium]|nr:glycosyltransferase [Pseudomonadota bacterium]
MSDKSHPGVLIVGTFISNSIANRSVCEDLAARLAASRWAVVTTSSKLSRIPRLLDMVNTIWSKRSEYSVAQVDVYSGLAFVWAEIVCFILRVIGRPYILTLHGGNLPRFARRWPLRVRILLRSAAAVTTPSPYLQNQMKSHCDSPLLLPNALDLSAYRMRLRNQPGPRLVWLRAFHAMYNPTLAPRVVAQLAEEFPDTYLIMIGPEKGDGSLESVQQLAQKLGVPNRICFSGGVSKEEVSGLLDDGDIFLNTTNVDNTPVSVLEAMASGLCLVSTDVGGIPYLLKHEHDALLVPPDGPENMADAVRRILTEPGLAEHLSRNARMKAELFDWSVILPQWKNLFTEIAIGA